MPVRPSYNGQSSAAVPLFPVRGGRPQTPRATVKLSQRESCHQKGQGCRGSAGLPAGSSFQRERRPGRPSEVQRRTTRLGDSAEKIPSRSLKFFPKPSKYKRECGEQQGLEGSSLQPRAADKPVLRYILPDRSDKWDNNSSKHNSNKLKILQNIQASIGNPRKAIPDRSKNHEQCTRKSWILSMLGNVEIARLDPDILQKRRVKQKPEWFGSIHGLEAAALRDKLHKTV